MRTVRRLIFRTIAAHVGMVVLAFVALFFFIDFLEELRSVGKRGYELGDAIWTCVLMQGAHFYDLLPIALLIGSTLALARMAQTSEFTILRTGGLSPARALGLLGLLGAAVAVLMVIVGNWLVPVTESMLEVHKAPFSREQGLSLGRGGTWLRERRDTADNGQHLITVNVGAANSDGDFARVRIFEFDQQGQLIRRIVADKAEVTPIGGDDAGHGSLWRLSGVTDMQWRADIEPQRQDLQTGLHAIETRQLATFEWQSSLTPIVVSASVLPPNTMSLMALWRYSEHLQSNAQAAQRYEIEFWKKAFYPLVCLVMVALSLPFAYLHGRSGGMSLKIFGGVMLGISFVLVNHISSHLGLLQNWQPWVAAVAPSLLYLLLSMSVFAWLVRYR